MTSQPPFSIHHLTAWLDAFAPPHLAAAWDHVGLLVGDAAAPVTRVMTCLTVTPASAAEAVRERAELIVTHHPLPFKPLQRLTTDSTPGKLLLTLIRGGVAVYSPHTAFDSAAAGINQQLAEALGLVEIAPLVPAAPARAGEAALGAGRWGRFAKPKRIDDLAARLKQFLNIGGLHVVGPGETLIQSAAVACGSAGEFLHQASRAGCQLLVTGETSFHTCVEAEATGIALLLPGHYASERFGVERLAEQLGRQFPALTIWASRAETDPLRWD